MAYSGSDILTLKLKPNKPNQQRQRVLANQRQSLAKKSTGIHNNVVLIDNMLGLDYAFCRH